VASCTNNKDVFVCILRFYARRAYLQHYQTLLQELEASEVECIRAKRHP
jgi:hypothetical protein